MLRTVPTAAATDPLFAPHHRDGRFFCPWGAPRRTIADLLRWRLARRPPRSPESAAIPRTENDGSALARVAERATLHWIGHASVAFHEGETVALVDPHFGPRALAPPRQTPPGLPLSAAQGAAVGLLSHNHYDHLDRWTLRRLPRAMTWLVPLGLGATLRGLGFDDVRELDWWQTAEVRGWRFTFLPAQHWSRRLSQPENTTLWGSWHVDTGTTRAIFLGDSGFFDGFRAYGERFGPVDLAVLPIGAYAPRWFMQVAHMDPAEALQTARDLKAQHMVPVHWGTFDLSDEGLGEPALELARQLERTENANLRERVRVLPVGGSLAL